MQGVNENKLRRAITLRNNQTYVRGVVTLKFLIFLILGIILGVAFFNTSYVDKSAIDIIAIKRHFEGIFVGCETFSEVLLTVLMLSELEIRYLFLIFVSGFTYFCFIVSGLMLFGKGFLFGGALSALAYLSRDPRAYVSGRVIVAYLIFNLISSLILISMSASAYIFSFDFSTIKRNHFVLRRAPIIYKYSFSLILSLGGLIINNFLYCLFFYLL